MNDPYEDIINDYWDDIMIAYNDFKDKKPIIEFDIIDQKIYSCPGKDYIEHLSARSKEQKSKQNNTIRRLVKIIKL